MQNQVCRIASCGSGLTITPKAVEYSRILHAKWVYLAWQVTVVACRVHYRDTVDVCSPPAACVVPSRTMKTSHQRGNNSVKCQLLFLCLTTKVCCAFSNGVLSLVQHTLILKTSLIPAISAWLRLSPFQSAQLCAAALLPIQVTEDQRPLKWDKDEESRPDLLGLCSHPLPASNTRGYLRELTLTPSNSMAL